jgi:hypothetical protein
VADEQAPFADVRIEDGEAFSIPELKWRELLFIGALKADGDAFVRDPWRPLTPFVIPGLFPEGARFGAVRREGRVVIRRLPA